MKKNTSKHRTARPKRARQNRRDRQVFAALAPALPSLGAQQALMGLAAFEAKLLAE